MKMNTSVRFQVSKVKGRQIIATFGTARLVRNLNGRHELIGEWCSLFAHEIVIRHAPAESGHCICRMNFGT
jgi:hypothetical protein